ncbi:sugar phosphate nucleotidyltransferase, partial [Planctomycetota bacterium]
IFTRTNVFMGRTLVEPLAEAIRSALKFIEDHPKALFTFGIKARYAHTGLGYLKKGDDAGQDGINEVAAFKEKPNKSTAHKYIRSGKYCWNSGMFVWRVDTILEQLERFLPHNAERLRRIGAAWNIEEVLRREFGELENISIDFGVMERAKQVYMCELDCHWEDVGSYQTLADSIGTIDQDDNVTTPETLCEWLDCQKNIAISESPDHLIAAIHVEDLIIVHTADATLICRRDETDRLRDILAQLKDKGHEQYL